jgi:hypothetical protein
MNLVSNKQREQPSQVQRWYESKLLALCELSSESSLPTFIDTSQQNTFPAFARLGFTASAEA